MREADRIAVVIPCFNDGATLGDAIRSLEGQEVAELVVVDDGSTEHDTLEELEALRASGVTVIRQENRGLAAARMRGVHETSARYVMPLDADDELGPGVLSALADALDGDPAAVAAWGDVQLFGDMDFYVKLPLGLDPWKVTYVSDVPGTSMVRRTALFEVGGWELRDGNEDWDLWMAFAERGWHGVYVPRLMLRYRIQRGRMNHDVLAAHSEQIDRLATRHPALFAARGANWRRSRASLRARLLFPLADRAPVSSWNRRRLLHAIDHPARVVRLRRQRKLT